MKRPYVIINGAMSADGKSALPSGKQLRISCEEDLARMYQLRHECDAVLVGIGTILSDDPKLTVKETYVKHPRQPLRVVLDSKGRTPSHALVLNTAARTLLLTAPGYEKKYPGGHIEVLPCKTDEKKLLDLKQILEILSNKGIKKVLVEGGGTVIWNFLQQQLVDDIFFYIGPCVVGGKKTPTIVMGEGIRKEDEVIPLKLTEIKPLGPGILLHYVPLR